MWRSRVSVLIVTMLSLGNAAAHALPEPLTAQTIAQNQMGPSRGPGMRPGMGGEGQLFKQLNLSQEQMQKIQEIRARYKGQMEQRGQAVRQAQQELGNLMAGTAEAGQIREKHRQVEQLRQQMASLRFESMLEIREILSVEQRRQLAQMMMQRRENSRNRPDNGGPGGADESL